MKNMKEIFLKLKDQQQQKYDSRDYETDCVNSQRQKQKNSFFLFKSCKYKSSSSYRMQAKIRKEKITMNFGLNATINVVSYRLPQ